MALQYGRKRCMFLNCAMSSPWDCLKHFILLPWQMCSFHQSTLHFTPGRRVHSIKALYTSPLADVFIPSKHFTLHPWQTCLFHQSTLHFTPGRRVHSIKALYTSPLADVFIPSKHFTLHPWQTCSFHQSTLHFTPGRCVHSITNSSTVGNIKPGCNYCTKITLSYVSTIVYSQ